MFYRCPWIARLFQSLPFYKRVPVFQLKLSRSHEVVYSGILDIAVNSILIAVLPTCKAHGYRPSCDVFIYLVVPFEVIYTNNVRI